MCESKPQRKAFLPARIKRAVLFWEQFQRAWRAPFIKKETQHEPPKNSLTIHVRLESTVHVSFSIRPKHPHNKSCSLWLTMYQTFWIPICKGSQKTKTSQSVCQLTQPPPAKTSRQSTGQKSTNHESHFGSEHSPLVLGLIDDQEDLELLGQGGRWSRLLHERCCRRSRLLDCVGDGAEGAEEAGGATGGRLSLLGLLGQLAWTPLLSCRGAGRCLGWRRGFGRGLGRARHRGWGCDLLGGG